MKENTDEMTKKIEVLEKDVVFLSSNKCTFSTSSNKKVVTCASGNYRECCICHEVFDIHKNDIPMCGYHAGPESIVYNGDAEMLVYSCCGVTLPCDSLKPARPIFCCFRQHKCI